jgi:hypothetical protein
MQHPEAQGTLEAIVEWWLLQHRIQQVTAEVRAILAELVGKGFIVERRQLDGRTCYALNRSKEKEILEWLSPAGRPEVSQPDAPQGRPGSLPAARPGKPESRRRPRRK